MCSPLGSRAFDHVAAVIGPTNRLKISENEPVSGSVKDMMFPAAYHQKRPEDESLG